MEGPILWTSPSSHTSWCQIHFISSRLGTQGLPLQDYFLLWFVFQLETLGAPRQGGGFSAVAQEASKGPEWNASWGDCWPGRRGPREGALDGGPHSFSNPPTTEGLYLWAEGNFKGWGWRTPATPSPGARRGAGNTPPPMMD